MLGAVRSLEPFRKRVTQHVLLDNRATGTLPGSLDVGADGAASYRIPLWVPPGRAGTGDAERFAETGGGANGGRGAIAAALDEPLAVVAVPEGQQGKPQLLDRAEALDPEHVLVEGGDEALGTAIAWGSRRGGMSSPTRPALRDLPNPN